VLRRGYSAPCQQKQSPAQVDRMEFCQGGAKRSPRRGPARDRSDNSAVIGQGTQATRTAPAPMCVSLPRLAGRARHLLARLARCRSAAEAGRTPPPLGPGAAAASKLASPRARLRAARRMAARPDPRAPAGRAGGVHIPTSQGGCEPLARLASLCLPVEPRRPSRKVHGGKREGCSGCAPGLRRERAQAPSWARLCRERQRSRSEAQQDLAGSFCRTAMRFAPSYQGSL
jgi:hypothetical protein